MDAIFEAQSAIGILRSDDASFVAICYGLMTEAFTTS